MLTPEPHLEVPLPPINGGGASCKGQGHIEMDDGTMEPEGKNHNEESFPGRSLPHMEQENNGEIVVGDVPSVSDGKMVSGKEAHGAASRGEGCTKEHSGPVEPETDPLGNLDEEHLPVIRSLPPLVEQLDGETGQKAVVVNRIMMLLTMPNGNLREDMDESVSSNSEGSSQKGMHILAATSGCVMPWLQPDPPQYQPSPPIDPYTSKVPPYTSQVPPYTSPIPKHHHAPPPTITIPLTYIQHPPNSQPL
ncbi:hypothetical protein F5051DRAFT_433730 [Lentinula edodes]|nr:hypothetical protein F5051DRAFT_433730 [Lentinula edodes]